MGWMRPGRHVCFGVLSLCGGLASWQGASAQARTGLRSEDFREVFVTAGYSAAFGAAAGAALLPFLPGSPIDNLRYVAGSASIGFLLGSAIGFYNASQERSAYEYTQPDNEISDGYPSEGQALLQSSGSRSWNVPTPRSMALIVGSPSGLTLQVPKMLVGPGLLWVPVLDMSF